MTVYKGYMKIIKQNKGMILLYLIIFFGITAIFQAAAKKENYSSYQAESVKIALVDADGGPIDVYKRQRYDIRNQCIKRSERT